MKSPLGARSRPWSSACSGFRTGVFEVWAHLRASKPPPADTRLRFADAFDAAVLGRAGADDGLFHLRFPEDPLKLLAHHGHVPLIPYISHADSGDDERHDQTVFARHPAAVAAPTAALNLDAPLLEALAARGVRVAAVTLHVGAGTFQPGRARTASSADRDEAAAGHAGDRKSTRLNSSHG